MGGGAKDVRMWLMPHLILLGDSIFDNATYTSGGPDVVSQVRKVLPPEWAASLLAVDGSTTTNVPDQISRLPKDATHLVLSVGGNNALTDASRLGISLFAAQSAPSGDPLRSLADVSDDFEAGYRSAVGACLDTHLPLSVCTIYNGCFPDAAYQRIAAVALTVFNDVILRVATEHRLPIIDLRFICTSAGDYANPIEPSSVGGEKIARTIVELVAGTGSKSYRTGIFATPVMRDESASIKSA
jgi:hypothetical protein